MSEETVTMTQATEQIDEAGWQRVSPKYIVVDVIAYLMSGILITGISTVPWFVFGFDYTWLIPIAVGIFSIVMLALTPRRVRAIGYQLRADDLLFRRGIMWQRIVAVPYGRMQLIDINRGPVARAVGLSELKFVTASTATGVVIPGLLEQTADDLRDTLVALAESRRAGL
jgi:uncharacterized protein